MSSVEIVPFEAEHAAGVARLCTTVQWPSLSDPCTVERCVHGARLDGVRRDHRRPGGRGWAQALGDGVLQSHLSFLAVHPDHRRRGIARLLTTATFQSTHTLRMDSITDSADGFYTSFPHKKMSGFRIYPGA